MKQIFTFLLLLSIALPLTILSQNQGKQDILQKANNTVNKVSNVIAVFQPYLLKARQLFFDAKQLATDVKNSSKDAFGKNSNNNVANNGANSSYNQQNNSNDTQSGYNGSSQYGNNTNTNNNQNNYGNNNNSYGNNQPGTNNYQNYLPNQNLPINNPATVNNDATGNWGNQNNGLYGNCLDALTGTVIGMGDAAQNPTSVDLLFFAPADGQNTYCLMTPGFARNNNTAGYMTEHTSDQVLQWKDVNESEVALTKLTIGQFDQIQNNSQIQNAVRNAQDYAGYYTSVGQKLDGQVFALKIQMESREVYALVAVVRQVGTSGSNGYLKIKIKSAGIDANRDGTVDANAYMR